jgi:hypothetical protein
MEKNEIRGVEGFTLEQLAAHSRVELLPDRIVMRRRKKRCGRRKNDPCPFIFRPRR